MRKSSFLIIVFTFLFVNCYSQAGMLDPSFGSDGKVYTNILDLNKGNERCKAVAIQPDGKILAIATTVSPSLLLRYLPDGTPDSSFHNDGTVFSSLTTAIVLQNDGKIIVVGGGFSIARYNSDGSVDSSFGGIGRIFTDVGPNADYVTCVAIQSDGKIVVAGNSYNGSNNDFAVVRYNSDGSLDNGFDNDGKVIISLSADYDEINSVAIQSDGKIVVAGRSYNDIALVRFNVDGSLDNTFDGDGKLITDLGIYADRVNSMAIQTDGKIVVGGNSNGGFVLLRYNTDGSLDHSFDGDGVVFTNINSGSTSSLVSVSIQSDGKIIAAGNSSEKFALARYNSDGSLDNSFDSDGKMTIGFYTYNSLMCMALQSDGTIVAGGIVTGTGANDFILTRFNTDGSPDNSFDGDGKLIFSFYMSHDFMNSFAIQNDGKIVATGRTTINDLGAADVAVVRYNVNGTLDNSFNGNGKLTTAFATYDDRAEVVAITADGKIVVVGSARINSYYELFILRYNPDGSPDNSFNGNGKVIRSFYGDVYVSSMAIQSDGKIVVTGYGSGFSVARYKSNGTPDSSFANGGFVTSTMAMPGPSIKVYCLAIQNDGKILLAGSTGTSSNTDFAMVRYNTNGSLDNSFDGDGKATTAISSSLDNITSIAIQSDSKILVGGLGRIDGQNNYLVLARYNSDGSTDNSFDGDGKMIGPKALSMKMILQNNGKILAGAPGPVLYRYNSDGSPDNSFDGDGNAVPNIGIPGSAAIASVMSYGDRIYFGGTITTPGAEDFLLVALRNGAVNASLPLRLLDFTGKKINDNEDALLTWKTENEVNSLEFIIERSIDGRNYTVVGSVHALNITGLNYYNFSDPKITLLNSSVAYYRLKQKDIDGGFTYSRIIALPLDKNKNIVLFYPNPVINEINVALTVNRQDKLQVKIIDNNGRIIKQQQWNVTTGSTSLSIDVKNITAGMYYLEIKGESIDYKKQFVK